MADAPIDYKHTIFMLEMFSGYTDRIVAALQGELDPEDDKDFIMTAHSLDWKANVICVVEVIDELMERGILPKPFEEGHLATLAANKGYELQSAPQGDGWFLYDLTTSSYVQNDTMPDPVFTEDEAYSYLSSLPDPS